MVEGYEGAGDVPVSCLDSGGLGGVKVPSVVEAESDHGETDSSNASLPGLGGGSRKSLARLLSEGDAGGKVCTTTSQNDGLEDLAVGALARGKVSGLRGVEDFEDVGVVARHVERFGCGVLIVRIK